MAWVTSIRVAAQVEYRLTEQCGCDREHGHEQQRSEDAQVDYRLGDALDLEWIGRGLAEVGIEPGTAVDPEAARALMNAVDPRSGEPLLIRRGLTDPRSHLPVARLVEAVGRMAVGEGTPVLRTRDAAALLGRMERKVARKGERARYAVQDLAEVAAAAGIALEEVYDADELAQARAFEGRTVDAGNRGYDLVLDLPKSFSALVGLAPPEVAAELEQAFLQAARETAAAVEQWCGYSLVGHNGDGRIPERHATSGLLGWMTVHRSARPTEDEHGTLRAGDPHLHVHLSIAALGRSAVDGKWRAVAAGGEDFYRHARAADSLVKARLRQITRKRWGMRWQRDPGTRAWEVVGVDERVRAEFSRRAAEVTAAAGEDASRGEMKAASARTREAKQGRLDPRDVRAFWREQAARLVDVDQMVRAAMPGPDHGGVAAGGPGGPVPPAVSALEVACEVFDPEHGLTAKNKAFTRAEALAHVMDAAPALGSAREGELLTGEVLAGGRAVPLPDDGRTARMANATRFTSDDVIAAEQTIVGEVTGRLGRDVAVLPPGRAEMALSAFEASRGFTLAGEQRAVVERLLTAGNGVDLVVGVAGAGKTTLMEAARMAWEASGLVVAGAATAAVAAANLTAESGIASRTVAAWLTAIRDGTGLEGVDVLVVDEAAMVDDRSLAALLTEAGRTGTKVVAIGDPQQLQPVGVGGGFAEAHRLAAGLTLGDNRRQRGELERAALQTWRTGRRSEAVRQLAAGGFVHATATVPQAHAALLRAWDTTRRDFTDPYERLDRLLLLAARNTDVDILNAACRTLARHAGELTGPEQVFSLPGGGRLRLAAGDVVRVRRNDYRSRHSADPDVLNGYRGVVTATDRRRGARVQWRRGGPDGPTVEHAWITPEQLARGDLSHGYAMTVAAAQGLTAEQACVYGVGADAHTAYPALTRARGQSHLYLALDAVETDDTLARLGAPRTDQERLQRAAEAWGARLDADRPAGMVTHELAEPAQVPEQARHAAAEQEQRRRQRADLRARAEARATIPPWHKRPHGSVPDPESAAAHAEERADRIEAQAAQAATRHQQAVEQALRGQGRHARALHERREQLRQAADLLSQADASNARAGRHESNADTHRARLAEIEPLTDWSRYRLWRAGTTREQATADVLALRAAAHSEDEQARTARGHAQTLDRQAHASAPGDAHDVRRAHHQIHQDWDALHAAAVGRDRAEADRILASYARGNGHEPADRAAALRAQAAGLREEAVARARLAELDPTRAAIEDAARTLRHPKATGQHRPRHPAWQQRLEHQPHADNHRPPTPGLSP